MDVCKHHFLVTEEENKLESLLHCIQFIFSFYELINHQVFPDYEEAIKNNISMPITSEVYKVLYEGKDCYQAINDLMNRELKEEF